MATLPFSLGKPVLGEVRLLVDLTVGILIPKLGKATRMHCVEAAVLRSKVPHPTPSQSSNAALRLSEAWITPQCQGLKLVHLLGSSLPKVSFLSSWSGILSRSEGSLEKQVLADA